MKEKPVWIVAILACAVAIMLLPANAKLTAKKKKISGEQIYQQHCASCHTAGGNNVKPKHPVVGSKQLVTLAVFKSYLSAPPGHMPYYQDVVNDKETLEALYKYCKTLKAKPVKQAFNCQEEQCQSSS